MAKIDMKKQLASLFPGAGQQPGGSPETEKEDLAHQNDKKTDGEAQAEIQSGTGTGIASSSKPEAPQKTKTAKPIQRKAQKAKKPSAPPKAPKTEKVAKAAVAAKQKALVVDQSAREKEYKVAFNLQLPQSLHTRLSHYADNFAVGRKSSVTSIIITAIEQHLGELEKKAGIKN